MRDYFLIFIFFTIIVFSCRSTGKKNSALAPPNIIFILADDLGYGDLGCYGQQLFETPHIDSLAAQGMRFTQFYAGSTVCAPSRSVILTGLHTGHTPIRGNKEMQPEGQHPLPDSTFTIFDLFQQAGYVTGAFGKWGLGGPGSEGEPGHAGVDEFYGFNCQRLAHNYYPRHLWHNTQKVDLPENADTAKGVYAPERIHEQALQFLENNRNKPFFLFYPSILPHAELLAPERYMAKYRAKFLPEKQYKGYDQGDQYRQGPYGSQEESHAAFAAMVSFLDDRVGEIMQKLKDLGLDNNTLVVFASDNGPHLEGGADPDFFDSNGPYKGYKRDLYEGGIRSPFVARWPGQIKPGSTSDHIAAFWDILPTFAEVIGTSPPVGIDGISFLPTLLSNAKKQATHDYLYWEFHEGKTPKQALLRRQWKAIRFLNREDGTTIKELYNLFIDPAETNDVSAVNPERLKQMEELMDKARTPSILEGWNFK